MTNPTIESHSHIVLQQWNLSACLQLFAFHFWLYATSWFRTTPFQGDDIRKPLCDSARTNQHVFIVHDQVRDTPRLGAGTCREGMPGARWRSSNRDARPMFNGQKCDCRPGLKNNPAACPGGLVMILRRSAPCIKLVRLEKCHPSITASYIDVQMASLWLICPLTTSTPLQIRANQAEI